MSFGATSTQTTLKDPDTSAEAKVENIGGKNRLLTDTNISSINVPNGQDAQPDTYFTITAAGAIGDTIRVEIAATANDSTSPDSDLPAVDVTYTLVAEDVGDERQLALNVADELNDDTDFQNALLEANVVKASDADDLRPIIHVSSTQFSLTSEFHERPNIGDFAVTATGTTTVLLDSASERIVSRAKPTALARDPNNPHRLGILGISGSVRVRGEAVDQLFQEDALDGGSNDLTVNGSGTPVVFSVFPNAAGGAKKIVEQIKLFGNDTNIKVQNTKFLGLNSALTNGLLFEILKAGIVVFQINIKSSTEFLARFSTSASDNKIISQSGGDFIQSVFDLIKRNIVVELEPGSLDEVRMTVRDDLSGVDNLVMTVEGFEE